MGIFDPALRARAAYRGRHGRRARALAARLETSDDEVVLRPWELGLPRVVLLAAARARGFEPVGGVDALVGRGPWVDPVHCVRDPGADGS